MIVGNRGGELGKYPLIKFKEDNRFLLWLVGVSVTEKTADPIYAAVIETHSVAGGRLLRILGHDLYLIRRFPFVYIPRSDD